MVKITLRAARVNKGISQREAAQLLNVSKKTFSNWENGKTMPKLDKIEPLCEMLDVQYNDIRWRV